MNILYIDHYAGSHDMGMEYRPWYISREWNSMGHKTTIVAGDYSHLRQINPSISHDYYIEDGEVPFCWLRTGQYTGNGAKRAFSMLQFSRKLWSRAKWFADTFQPDVVISSSTYPMDTYGAQRIARLSGAIYVHEIHDVWPETLTEIGGMHRAHPFVKMVRLAANSAYKHSDGIVSILPRTEAMTRSYGFSGKWIYIPNGVVMPDGDKEPLPEYHSTHLQQLKDEDKKILLYFGGHALSNALDLLLDAAKQNHNDNISMVLVGDGVEKNRLVERVKKESIPNVTFLPSVPKGAIPELLSEVDATVITGIKSDLYRFGTGLNKLNDAMLSGVPIIYAMPEEDPLVSKLNCGLAIEENSLNATNLNETILKMFSM